MAAAANTCSENNMGEVPNSQRVKVKARRNNLFNFAPNFTSKTSSKIFSYCFLHFFKLILIKNKNIKRLHAICYLQLFSSDVMKGSPGFTMEWSPFNYLVSAVAIRVMRS